MTDTTRWIIIAIVVLVAGIAFWMLLPEPKAAPMNEEQEVTLEERIERGEIPPPPPPPSFFAELEGSTTTPEELMQMGSTSGVIFVE